MCAARLDLVNAQLRLALAWDLLRHRFNMEENFKDYRTLTVEQSSRDF